MLQTHICIVFFKQITNLVIPVGYKTQATQILAFFEPRDTKSKLTPEGRPSDSPTFRVFLSKFCISRIIQIIHDFELHNDAKLKKI